MDPSLPTDPVQLAKELDRILADAEANQDDITEAEDDAFRKVYIPRSLFEVKRYFGHLMRMKKGIITPDELYYQVVTGLRDSTACQEKEPTESESEEEVEEWEGEEELGEPGEGWSAVAYKERKVEEEEEDELDERVHKNPQRRPRHETTEERKTRKKEFREQKTLKRETKIPKKVKKKATGRGL